MRRLWSYVLKRSLPRSLALGIILGGVVASAQTLDCIVELLVPRYNLSSRRSSNGGTVAATVLIGPTGKAASVDTKADDENLASEVRGYLMRETTYSASCAGQTVTVKFTYVLEGPEQLDPPVFVRFRPPNHFIITSRPQKPIVDPPKH